MNDFLLFFLFNATVSDIFNLGNHENFCHATIFISFSSSHVLQYFHQQQTDRDLIFTHHISYQF